MHVDPYSGLYACCSLSPPQICLPVVFNPAGSIHQLVYGLLVCFLTFGMYVFLQPFKRRGDNEFGQICQMEIFIALLLSLVIKYRNVTDTESIGVLDGVLTTLLCIPIVSCFAFELMLNFCSTSPLAKLEKELEREEREAKEKEKDKKVDKDKTAGPTIADAQGLSSLSGRDCLHKEKAGNLAAPTIADAHDLLAKLKDRMSKVESKLPSKVESKLPTDNLDMPAQSSRGTSENLAGSRRCPPILSSQEQDRNRFSA